MVVFGTQQGIWMGKESDTNGLKNVLMTADVTQIGVLQAQNILLVLAGKRFGSRVLFVFNNSNNNITLFYR
jgi:hypothetical protein